MDQLRYYESAVARWSGELERAGWPLSVDHVDLNPTNGVVRADGTLVLYDWGEAIRSVPFFSLDRLLHEAREADGQEALDPPPGPVETAVRAAYLDALPWGDRAARERGLMLGLALAPIKLAWEADRFAIARGWDGHARLVGWYLVRALHRWRRLAT